MCVCWNKSPKVCFFNVFNVLFLKECNSECLNEPFSDSGSDGESNSEDEQDTIINEYDIIENEDPDFFFC